MKTLRNNLLFCTLFLLLATSILQTKRSYAYEIDFSGFMSIHGGFTVDSGDNSLEGYDDKVGFRPKSLFGLQMDVDLGNNLSLTSQFIAKATNNAEVRSEWYYLSYLFNNEIKISIGRISTPFFIHSQYLDVGYAYPWLLPPSYLYDMQFSAAEGIDFVYSTEFNSSWESNTELFFGRNNDVVSYDSVTDNQDISHLWVISSSINNQWLLLRVIHARADISIRTEFDSLVSIVRPISPAVANQIVPKEVLAEYYGAGFSIDYKQWIIISEISNTQAEKTNAFFKNIYRGYISIGKKIGNYTPYYTYQLERWLVHSAPQIDDPTLDNIITQEFEASNDKKGTHIIGIRYAFHRSSALTVEFHKQSDERGTDKQFNTKLLTFGVDVIF